MIYKVQIIFHSNAYTVNFQGDGVDGLLARRLAGLLVRSLRHRGAWWCWTRVHAWPPVIMKATALNACGSYRVQHFSSSIHRLVPGTVPIL